MGLTIVKKNSNALLVKTVLLHLGDYPDMNVAMLKKNHFIAHSVRKHLGKVVI